MIQTLGLLTGTTLSLLTPNQAGLAQLTIEDPHTASESAQVSDFSYQHQVMSTYGAEIPHINIDRADLRIKAEVTTVEIESTTEQQIDQLAMLSANPLESTELFDLVNAHRVFMELETLKEDEYLCSLADKRLPQLNEEIFGDTPMHKGMETIGQEFWITENLIHTTNETKALDWWLSSPIHRRSIESPTYTHSCIACTGNSCTQLFTSFLSKSSINQ